MVSPGLRGSPAARDESRAAREYSDSDRVEAAPPPGAARPTHGSDVEVGDAQGVVFDEGAAWLDHIAHQRGEDLVRRDGVLDPHLEQAARFRIDGGVPELLGV